MGFGFDEVTPKEFLKSGDCDSVGPSSVVGLSTEGLYLFNLMWFIANRIHLTDMEHGYERYPLGESRHKSIEEFFKAPDHWHLQYNASLPDTMVREIKAWYNERRDPKEIEEETQDLKIAEERNKKMVLSRLSYKDRALLGYPEATDEYLGMNKGKGV